MLFFAERKTETTGNFMAPQREKTNILVIDDERLIRLTLNAKLKLIGYTATCVASIPEAVTLLNDGGHRHYKAIITDIMMGDMDGFVFRDIVRGMDETIPIFFMTALDPEEGSGFLKRIMEDSYSFYLPKSINPNLLIKRVRSIVDSRRVEELVREKDEEVQESLNLSARLQRKMLPPRAVTTEDDFYTYWWKPRDVVSGDLLEIMPLPEGGTLYVLGDIQGHGISASLTMMAVQSFLKQLPGGGELAGATPATVANLMQHFFTNNLGTFSYMTALICIHWPKERIVDWISCGAPDLYVVDPRNPDIGNINPEKRGGLPIGLMSDTVYGAKDVVRTHLSPSALCVAFSDGVFDVYRDEDCHEQMPETFHFKLLKELLSEARLNDSVTPAPYKFQLACEAHGYLVFSDDVTEIIFGARLRKPGILSRSVVMDSSAIDKEAQQIERWCTDQGWEQEIITQVELVFEEKMMNLFDHGYDIRDRSEELACYRLRKNGKYAELTVWDWGTQEPGIPVAVGDPDLELELKNREFSSRGRGRLMVRKMCDGIVRNRYGALNETVYRIPLDGKAENLTEDSK
jgi:CheY-like chemotaxis protein/anti-sigma regulatory factor (Ser/Thr protein kinase)